MKRIVFITAILVLLTAALPLFAQNSASVERVRGKVEMQLPGRPWQAVAAGDQLPLGATISTGFRSEALLQIGSATLEVKALTRMRLDELVEREGLVETELFLRVGRVRAEVRPREGLQQEFRLKSPVSTAAVRGTSFDFDGVNLQVLTGLVNLANNYGQSGQVGAGEGSSTDGFTPPPEGQDALNQFFNVVTSTSGLEGGGGFEVPPELQELFGSITLITTIP
jgi:hypothetical protein